MLKPGVELAMQRSSTRICDNCRKRVAGRFAHRDLRHAGLLDRHADELLQLAGRIHLADDVAAADELPVDVELWNRRPLGERRIAGIVVLILISLLILELEGKRTITLYPST